MRILVLEQEDRVLDILDKQLKTEFQAEVVLFKDANAAIEDIKENHPALIIARDRTDDGPLANSVANYIYDNQFKTPMIIMGEEFDFNGIDFKCIPSRFKMYELTKLVKTKLNLSKEELEQIRLPDYIPFNISNFYLMSEAVCDIFIQIKKRDMDDQYVKRVGTGDNFDKEAIQNYEAKGVVDFYIKKEFRHMFMESLLDQSLAKIERPGQKLDEFVINLNDGYEIGQDLLINMGVSEHSIKMAEGSIKAMNKQVASNPQLKSLLAEVLGNKGSFAYRHSFLITIFGSELIKSMKWSDDPGQNEKNIEKFSYVAFFHDIMLKKDEHIKIYSKDDLREAKLPEDEAKLVSEHANKASTLIQSFPHTPNGVDIIIRQHHGTSNGVGFSEYPNSSLNALATLFIVVEDFVHQILSFEKGKDTMVSIFEKMTLKYESLTYRKSVEGLKKVVLKQM